ncbi:MAG TPA: hypothetical protein VH253_08820 [Phycisphaerae bacterium]|nr:hypothetical protein [Phycisphaerae bacterium]
MPPQRHRRVHLHGLDPIGGQFGFSANYGKVDIDNLTINSDPAGDGSFSTTELVETFTLDSSGYDSGDNPTYDANGNLTFDGTQVYTYDAWNRLVGVAHGYTDGSGDVQSGYQFDKMSYDGLGRLITEAISGEGSGHDGTVDNYYDGNQLIEQQSGTPVDGIVPAIKQNVWGLQYVNELVQTAVGVIRGQESFPDGGTKRATPANTTLTKNP